MTAIKKQIEFYFSDSNFRKDTFLREAAAADSEGYVPIATLLTFNKLKKLTTDLNAIKEAVETSELVEVSDDGLKIRRKYPLPSTDNSKDCTLYVKGFPLDDNDVTIETITEQFSQFGQVCMVRLRKDLTKKFKGSCFIEFAEPSSVDAAVTTANQNGTITLSFKETPYLCIMKLNEWLERKAAKSGKGEKKATNEDSSAGKRKRTAESSEEKKEGEEDENEGDGEGNEDGEEDAKQSSGVVSFTPGLILKISGIPESSTVYQVKDAFKPFGEVKYVEYNTGETTAFVRLGDTASVAAVTAALQDGNIKLEDEEKKEEKNLEGVLLVGDEEVAYWTKIGQGSSGKGSGRGGGRGRGRGGGRGGRGRGGRGNKKSRR